MKTIKVLLILSFVFGVFVNAKPPAPAKSSTLQIKGYVFHDDKKIDNAVVKLYQNNKIVQITKSKKSKFEFLLFSDLRYMVEVSLDDCITERLQISTIEKTEYAGKYTYEFRVDLMNTDELKGVDISDLDFPTALIKYNADEGEYWHDEDYAKSVRRTMKKLRAELRLINRLFF